MKLFASGRIPFGIGDLMRSEVIQRDPGCFGRVEMTMQAVKTPPLVISTRQVRKGLHKRAKKRDKMRKEAILAPEKRYSSIPHAATKRIETRLGQPTSKIDTGIASIPHAATKRIETVHSLQAKAQ